MIPSCKVCGEEFNPARAELGYSTCLEHGEQDAMKIADARRNSFVLQHKQTYVFVQSKEEVRALNTGKIQA